MSTFTVATGPPKPAKQLSKKQLLREKLKSQSIKHMEAQLEEAKRKQQLKIKR